MKKGLILADTEKSDPAANALERAIKNRANKLGTPKLDDIPDPLANNLSVKKK